MRRKRFWTIALVLALLLAVPLGVQPAPVAHAATITVNTTDDELNSDGDCSLREAIQAANTDTAVSGCAAGGGADTITLPAGTYTLTIPGADEEDNATGDLDITWWLTINGDGEGTTIIQAGTNSPNGIDRVLDVHGENIHVEINDVTIRHGRVVGIAGDLNGGGIRNHLGRLTLNNSSVGLNIAGWSGGGIWNVLGTLTLNNSLVALNWADSYGGGIYNTGTVTLNNSTVSFNTAHGGGGIYNAGIGSILTLNNSSVRLNTADGSDGGGISNSHGWVTLDNCTISGNDTHSGGGGIYSSSGTVTLDNCTISGNDADSGGGGISNYDGRLTLDNCTVSGNDADTHGGGIYHDYSSLTLNNSTIANNTADDDNDGSGDGGGVRVGHGQALVMNTIIGDNQDRSGEAHDCSGTLTSQGYNLVEDTTGCTFTTTTGDIIGSDPNLGALADNGGPTYTHALQTGSPAIEQIPDGTNSCQAGVSTDQRGYVRAGGGPGNGGSLCDIGAYEYNTVPVVLPTGSVYLPIILKSH